MLSPSLLFLSKRHAKPVGSVRESVARPNHDRVDHVAVVRAASPKAAHEGIGLEDVLVVLRKASREFRAIPGQPSRSQAGRQVNDTNRLLRQIRGGHVLPANAAPVYASRCRRAARRRLVERALKAEQSATLVTQAADYFLALATAIATSSTRS